MTPNSNVKEVIKWLADLSKAGDSILADGKVSFIEVLQLVSPLTALTALLPKFAVAKDEWINGDSESKADSTLYAEAQFDFTNDKLETKVEAAFGAIIHIGTLLQ